jgi:hypothetical protein
MGGKMRRIRWLWAVSGLLLTVILVGVLWLQGADSSEIENVGPDLVSTFQSEQAAMTMTESFQRTAIVQLTDVPRIAQTMTPFYGDVLFNEAVSYITVTPTLNPVGPTPECWLVPDFWELPELEQVLADALAADGFESNVEAFVSVVWNTEQCETYLPVSNRIRIWIESNAVMSTETMVMTIHAVSDVLTDGFNPFEDISPLKSNVSVTLYYTVRDETRYIATDLQQLETNAELTGDTLIGALGGLPELESDTE